MTAYAADAPGGMGALLAAIRTPLDTATRSRPAPRPRVPTDRPVTPLADRTRSASDFDPRDHRDHDGRGPHRQRPAPPEPRQPGDRPDDAVWPLVTAAQHGDVGAFAALYDRYVDLVFRYIYFRVGDRPTAEDFTSETFLRALRRIGSLANIGRDPGAWFVTIARNIVLDHVKSSRYRLEITTDELSDIERSHDGLEKTVVDQLTHESLLACVKQLGSEQQECIVLRFLHGFSVAETAAAMGKNEGAIKALQHRAVRRLATLVPQGLR